MWTLYTRPSLAQIEQTSDTLQQLRLRSRPKRRFGTGRLPEGVEWSRVTDSSSGETARRIMNTTNILLVSGGAGASGDQLVRTALAQFPNAEVTITIVPQIRQPEQLEQVIAQASTTGAIIVHTLVDTALRARLVQLAHDHHIPHIDLIGALLNHLQLHLRQAPLEQPGRYRKLRERDLKRIEAIEFAVEHDDGQRIHELARAEVVLTGVSRVGKTPLSVYLSTMGWKVANVPLVKDINPPPALFEIDHRRVIGLTIDAGQLVAYRQRRQHHLGTSSISPYSEPQELVEELEFAQRVFRQGQFAVVNMTDKPVEEGAHEIANLITRKLT
jgi:regulator of PEP synthase PpsR (kinase-PPPase family)